MVEALLPLSPVDYVFTGVGSYPIQFALGYEGSIDAARLQGCLDETLEYFWPLASRLVRVSEQSYAFQRTADGLALETTSSTETFEDAEDLSRFVEPVVTAEREPLTRIKLTATPRGSVLGVSISHALADGYSYFHFLASWSRVFQGKRVLSPVHQREVLAPDIRADQQLLTAEDVLARCGLFWAEKRPALPAVPFHEERRTLSREAMNELLARAQEECEVPLFHNDVLTALLWKECITQWNSGQDNPVTYVSCPVDFRRLVRAVPRTYFGSAICSVTASLDYQSLANASLGQLAPLVRKAVAQVREDYVLRSLSTLETLRRQRGLDAMEEIHVGHPHHGMVVTNISRLPMQSLDFGAGTPTAFRALSATARAAAILPAQDGVEIRIFHP